MKQKSSRIIVERKFVHKAKQENVHLSNLRRALPGAIDGSVFDRLVDCSADELEVIRRSFVRSRRDNIFLRVGIPEEIDTAHLRQVLRKSARVREHLRFFSRFYRRDRGAGRYLLVNHPNEIEEKRLKGLTGKSEGAIPEESCMQLASILERQTELPKDDVFLAWMEFDIHHPYFFEHRQEHVPGMLLIESCRQMAEACCHIFGNVPLKGASFLWNSLEVNFLNYVELHMPVRIMAENRQSEKGPEGYWLSPTIDFTVYQLERPVAEMTLAAQIASERAFKRMRLRSRKLTEAATEIQSRFMLRHGIHHIISLRDEIGTEYPCTMQDLSVSGFSLEVQESEFKGAGRSFDFHIAVERTGLVIGKAVCRWAQEVHNQAFAGFEITEISQKDEDRLRQVIKLCTFAREDRLT